MPSFENLLLSAIEKGKEMYGSAAELARVSGVLPANISRWVNKKQKPRLEEFAPILEAVGAKITFGDEHFVEYDYIPKVAAKAGAGSSLETSGLRGDFFIPASPTARIPLPPRALCGSPWHPPTPS